MTDEIDCDGLAEALAADAELESWQDGHAALLGIVRALAAANPVAPYSADRPYAIRCVLCDVEPPGSCMTMVAEQHAPTCPWRLAQDIGALYGE